MSTSRPPGELCTVRVLTDCPGEGRGTQPPYTLFGAATRGGSQGTHFTPGTVYGTPRLLYFAKIETKSRALGPGPFPTLQFSRNPKDASQSSRSYRNPESDLEPYSCPQHSVYTKGGSPLCGRPKAAHSPVKTGFRAQVRFSIGVGSATLGGIFRILRKLQSRGGLRTQATGFPSVSWIFAKYRTPRETRIHFMP